MRFQLPTFLLQILLCAASVAAQQAPPRELHEQLAVLNHAQIDPAAVYKVNPSNRIELRRGDAKFSFDEGYVAFFQPVTGKVTGAVFSGRGHLLAIPRDPIEKQQLAHFLNAPVVDQDFSSAYIRFTDDTASELRQDFQTAQIDPQTNSGFTDAWQAAVVSRNPVHSFRILSETFSKAPRPYFSATLAGIGVGSFEFVYDLEREEPQLFGQGKKSGGADYYDVWSSYRPPGILPG